MIKNLQIFMLLVITFGYTTFMKADETAEERYGYPNVLNNPATEAEPSRQDIRVEFNLVNREGKHVTQEDFRGKYILLTFGYTHCEHICPTILDDMARTLKASGNLMTGIFISVDTERDTPAKTDDYASGFSQKITGLSGSHEEVATAANNFNVRYSVTKTQNHYMVQHSSDIFYIDPDGHLIHIYTFNSLPHDLEKL